MWREKNILVLSDNWSLIRALVAHLRRPDVRVSGRLLTSEGFATQQIEADLIVVALSASDGVPLTAVAAHAGPMPLLVVAGHYPDKPPAKHVHCMALPFDGLALRQQVGTLLDS
jgi:hypothetical protein